MNWIQFKDPVSHGGDGFYYFSVFLTIENFDYGLFNLENLCTTYPDKQTTARTDFATKIALVPEDINVPDFFHKIV